MEHSCLPCLQRSLGEEEGVVTIQFLECYELYFGSTAGVELTEVSVEGRGSDKKSFIPPRPRNVKPQEFLLMNFIPF